MDGINKVFISGTISNDVRYKALENGMEIANFTVVTNTYRGKDKPKEAHFQDCVLFGKLAPYFAENLKKGDGVTVLGRLRTEKFKDKDGNDRQKVVVLVEEYVPGHKKGSGGGKAPDSEFNEPQWSHPEGGGSEIPF